MMVLYYSWWDESTTTEWALFDLSIRLHRHVQGLNILFAGRFVLCLHYARGGEGGTDPIYWSRYVYERENFKSQRSGEILKFSH